jgi:hypothetical protein
MRTAGPVVLVLCIAVAAAAQQPSSSRPAAQAQRPALDPAVAGKIVRGDYSNDVIGLQLRRLDGWETMTRGEMNLNEAVGRAAMGQKGGIQSTYRVFGMHDGMGSSVYLSIVPIPTNQPAPTLAEIQSGMARTARQQVPDGKVSNEPAPLATPAHPVAATRVEYVLQDHAIAQSAQSFLTAGFLVTLTVTSDSPEKLSTLLGQVKAALSWR